MFGITVQQPGGDFPGSRRLGPRFGRPAEANRSAQKEDTMTTALVEYTPQELELETAELLPARETLCCYSHPTVWQSQSSSGLINVNNVLNNNSVQIGFGNSSYGNSGNFNG